MKKWARHLYQPGLPLRESGRVTCSEEHIALSLKAAEEGMVLLKNEGKLLPLKKGTKVALFGKGTFDYVKGGGGSGDVFTKYIRNVYEGLKEVGLAETYEPLNAFYKKNVDEQYAKGIAPGMLEEPKLPENLLKDAAAVNEVAVISISRFSGEGWDRSDIECNNEYNPWGEGDDNYESMPKRSGRLFPDGDFYLSAAEKRLVKAVTGAFSKVVVLLNVGGIVDTTWIKKDKKIGAALLVWQGGMEGGLAAAKTLLGLNNPSGKLPDTFAEKLTDYPSTEHFHDSFDYVDYTEDIFVGYRYFETVPGADKKVVYPFGYGLSYTDFSIQASDVWEDDGKINLFVKVTNIGTVSGKEVVQVYFEAPDGKISKPARVLLAYAKTKELEPGETRTLSFEIPVEKMASYDDLGKIKKSAWVLEKGEYKLFVGSSVREALELDYTVKISKDTVTEQLSEKLNPVDLKERLLADGTFEKLPKGKHRNMDECGIKKMKPGTEECIVPASRGRDQYGLFKPFNGKRPFIEVFEGKITLDEFVKQLSDDELIHLLGGQPNTGVANTWGIGNLPEYGIPSIMTADGPAGVRLAPETGVNTTAWPCATLLASTWNDALLEELGDAVGQELKENNLGMWLAPALNIHRNPMNGRNFEYYSEDPLLSGKLAAAVVRGVQSNGVSACIKHFACNNKETNRKHCDSRVSERALREIYLKGFEITVKESDPWSIMTAYNTINGYRAAECYDLITGILRGEWGYNGIVISDWWNRSEHYKEILAGEDVKMATGFPDRVKMAMEKGLLKRKDLEAPVKRILEFIMKLD